MSQISKKEFMPRKTASHKKTLYRNLKSQGKRNSKNRQKTTT